MPNLEEHCEHTFKRYGVRGEDIHRWLDEPCRAYGRYHRSFRHDKFTVQEVGRIFGSKYGEELAKNIALDHLMLDRQERRKGQEVRRLNVYHWDWKNPKSWTFNDWLGIGLMIFIAYLFIKALTS